jgi:hypothetical protein
LVVVDKRACSATSWLCEIATAADWHSDDSSESKLPKA